MNAAIGSPGANSRWAAGFVAVGLAAATFATEAPAGQITNDNQPTRNARPAGRDARAQFLAIERIARLPQQAQAKHELSSNSKHGWQRNVPDGTAHLAGKTF